MAKDPAVLFYTSDFISGTAFFNDEQRGQYILLLCQQHQLYSIPFNHMINVCKSSDSPVFKKFTKDSDGTYYNIRMREEGIKRANFCASRSNNNSGRKKNKSYDSHMDNHMENENENRNIVKNSSFKVPTIGEVRSYCLERNNKVDPQNFIDHYQTNGWVRGKTKIKDWKACVRTWEKTSGFKPKEEKQVYVKPDPKQQEEVAKLIRETVDSMK